MDNMEGDGELPRCGGCGRTFERRAALAAHTYTCQPRSRALARRPHENKRIEIQIRKDYNKGPTVSLNMPSKNADDTKSTDDSQSINKSNKEDEKIIEEDCDEEKSKETMCEDDEKSNNNVIIESLDKIEEQLSETPECIPIIRLPFAQQAERSNLKALKQKIHPDIELEKLQCKKCDTKYKYVQELYDHMASHYKWMRYSCKLCNYKNYHFEKLPEHVKIVHKLKGDTDFYFSTIKAIEGAEALELSESTDELNDVNETSPDSRRPSRCSSDSSRLSDDSSSSTRVEVMGRKRRIHQNKNSAKRKKESLVNDDGEEQKDISAEKAININLTENESSANIKGFEENSSDMDDLDDKITKKQLNEDTSSVASRRPVRKRTKPKYEDFEYDLSNLLKMEAQGYRDSQSIASAKTCPSKKKSQPDINYDKDFSGALSSLSKKSAEDGKAHIKTLNFRPICSQKERPVNVFARPMLPKTASRSEKTSPKREGDDAKNSFSPNKDTKCNQSLIDNVPKNTDKVLNDSTDSSKDKIIADNSLCETVKTNLNIPAVVPIKFRRQSLEVIKNPLINKNITDFSKAGMKTKILVIKPINRSKDGTQTLNTPVKYQTIKLKDPRTGNSSTEGISSDQVMVVKVPKVDCKVVRPLADKTTISNEKTNTQDSVVQDSSRVVENIEETNGKNETVKSVNASDSSNKDIEMQESNCTAVKTVAIEDKITEGSSNCANELDKNDNNTT